LDVKIIAAFIAAFEHSVTSFESLIEGNASDNA